VVGRKVKAAAKRHTAPAFPAQEPLHWVIAHAPPAIAAIAVATFVIIAFDPRPPVEIESVKINPETVRAGENATAEIRVKVLRDCGGHLTRTLVSEAEGHPTQLYDVVKSTLPADHGKIQTIERPFHVPSGFSRGPAVFRSKIAFHCNPLNEWWPITITAPDARVVIEAASKK